MKSVLPVVMLSPADVGGALKLGGTALDDQHKRGLLTDWFYLNKRVRRLPSNEVQAIVEARAAGLTDDEVRQVVHQQHELRRQRAAALRAALASNVAARAA